MRGEIAVSAYNWRQIKSVEFLACEPIFSFSGKLEKTSVTHSIPIFFLLLLLLRWEECGEDDSFNN